MILQLGDYQTEERLLDPLLASVENSTTLVLSPEDVWRFRIRTVEEFRKFRNLRGGGVSHLVLVGHGSMRGLIFGDSIVEPKEFISVLQEPAITQQAPVIISLCCKSGNGIVGKAISSSPSCRSFIGPSGSIHASNAALFYQSFLVHNLLEGNDSEKAYQLSRVFTPGVTEFNLWRKSVLAEKLSRKKVLGY